MTIRDMLILASFVGGILPLVLLTGIYAWRGNWRATQTGRAFFYLFSVFIIWGVLSIITLIWPGPMRGEAGEWIRIVIRLGTDVVVWNVFRVFLSAQRRTAGPGTPAHGIQVTETDRT